MVQKPISMIFYCFRNFNNDYNLFFEIWLRTPFGYRFKGAKLRLKSQGLL